MAQASISVSRGWKVLPIQSARSPRVMKESLVDTSPGDGMNAAAGQKFRTVLRLPGGEDHPVHRGDKTDGIAYGGGVHVMLQKRRRHHQGSGGKIGEAAGHPRVYDELHTVAQTQDFRGHGGVHLAHAAGAHQDIRSDLIEIHAGNRLKGGETGGTGQSGKL